MLLAILLAATPQPQPVTVTGNPDYATSSFGASRVASPYRLADVINTYGLDTDVWAVRTDGGSVTHLPNESALLMTGIAGGGVTELRTDDQYRYQAGAGQRIYQTVVSGPTDAGQVYRWGYYDDGDGLYWQHDSSGLRFVSRTSTDGGVTNSSKSVAGTRDLRSGNIFEIAFQWLGVGLVRTWVNGSPAVQVPHAGLLGQAYMKTAYLPLSYEARGGAADAKFKVICASVQSEGGSNPPKPTFAQRRNASLSVAGQAANVPIISVRAARFFNGQASRVQLEPTNAWCFSNSQRIRADVIYNPGVLTSAAFSSAFTESAADFDTAATGYDGGVFVAGFGVPAASAGNRELNQAFGELNRKLRRRAFASNVDAGGLSAELDTVTIAITNPDNVATLVNCGLEWGEVR
jgi:hypothetical protein